MKRVGTILLVIAISVVILFTSLEIHAFSLNGFMKSFRELGIDNETGKTFEELELISRDLIDYIKVKGGNELLEPHFNQREILHMEDVQVLFKNGFLIRNILIVFIVIAILIFIKNKDLKYLLRSLTMGLSGNWIVLLILGLMVKIDFNKYFTYFHLIFFNNDLWLLDPATDLMIQMLPEKFFVNIVVRTIFTFVILIGLLQILSVFGLRKLKED